jgi:hypothetical protein
MASEISKEAVEAAYDGVMRQRRGMHPQLEHPPLALEEQWEIQAALRAALPHLAPQPTQAMSKEAAQAREIAALREALSRSDGAIQKAAMYLGSTDEWTDQETMIADFEARLSGSPAPDLVEDQSEYGPMVYSDQTQPTVYPSASVRAPIPAEAMRHRIKQLETARDTWAEAYRRASVDRECAAEAMRVKTLDECEVIARGEGCDWWASRRVADAIAALKDKGEGRQPETGQIYDPKYGAAP